MTSPSCQLAPCAPTAHCNDMLRGAAEKNLNISRHPRNAEADGGRAEDALPSRTKQKKRTCFAMHLTTSSNAGLGCVVAMPDAPACSHRPNASASCAQCTWTGDKTREDWVRPYGNRGDQSKRTNNDPPRLQQKFPRGAVISQAHQPNTRDRQKHTRNAKTTTSRPKHHAIQQKKTQQKPNDDTRRRKKHHNNNQTAHLLLRSLRHHARLRRRHPPHFPRPPRPRLHTLPSAAAFSHRHAHELPVKPHQKRGRSNAGGGRG